MKTIPGWMKSSRLGWLLALTVLGVVCYAIAARIVELTDYHHTDNDFFTFWLAGRLVSQGGNPYDTSAWVAGYRQFEMSVLPNPAFLYPLPLALLYLPLGMLPFQTAYILWVMLLQLMLVASLGLLLALDASPRSKLLLIPLLAGAILFRPTILTLFQGQLSGLLLFILTGMVFLWKRGKWAWGGVLLSLLGLKPNIGGPLIILLSLWLLSRKQFTPLLVIFASGITLIGIGLIQNPYWLVEYWQVGNAKLTETFGGSPTLWGLSALVCKNQIRCTLPVGGAAAILVIAGFAWLVFKIRIPGPLTVISLAVTVTLLVTPYTWTYDQALLILPIAAVTLALARDGLLRATFLFLAIDILAVILLFFNTAMEIEILNALVPLAILGLCAAWSVKRPGMSADG